MLTLDFDPFPMLQTERLVLREIGYLDAQEIHVLRSDPRIMAYLDRDPDVSVEATATFINLLKENLQGREGIVWGISLQDKRKLIGTAGFWRIDAGHRRAEIGYTIHPDHQGRGYMHEALQIILDYGWQRMNLHSVEANVNPNNTASIELLENNGFVKEGHFKENWYYNGKFLDSAVYSLLRSSE